MRLESPAFAQGSSIPRRYTCEGSGAAPALGWSQVPPGTRSFALIVHDPDAPDPARPRRDFVHWLLYDLPASTTGLPEGGSPLPQGTLRGKTDFGGSDWGGPCPPIGRHRYVFDLYALDTVLPDLHEPSRARLEAAMQGHVLGKAELVGTYQKGE